MQKRQEMQTRKLLAILLLAMPLLSQRVEYSNKYTHIREYLSKGDTASAQKELSLLLKNNDSDPTLLLYQTEIWISEGERNFQKGKFQKSRYYFDKAGEHWPNHPLVMLRRKELKQKEFAPVGLNRPMSFKQSETAASLPAGSLPFRTDAREEWIYGIINEEMGFLKSVIVSFAVANTLLVGIVVLAMFRKR